MGILLLFSVLFISIQFSPISACGEISEHFDCGGVLNSSHILISYKADLQITPNERCVWTIRTNLANNYTLDVISFGLPSNLEELGLTATCINSYDTNNISVAQVKVEGHGAVQMQQDCPVLVLTYFSGKVVSNARGFTALVTANNGTIPVSSNSVHYIFSDIHGHIRHPLNIHQNYSNHELSTFVFIPPKNYYSLQRKTVLTYLGNGLEGNRLPNSSCYDRVLVLKFHPSGTWSSISENQRGADQICGETEYKNWISSDVIMLLFRTDGSQVSFGFHLTFLNYEESCISRKI